MKKKTVMQQYIEDAVKQSKEAGLGGSTVDSCNFHMEVQLGDAAKVIAQALQAQAEANEATADALNTLASKLGMEEACLLKIS